MRAFLMLILIPPTAGGVAEAAGLAAHVTVPAVSGEAAAGRDLFAARCGACHGNDAGGTGTGPSLILPEYAPGALPDAAFARAVREGLPPGRWMLGPMPGDRSAGAGRIAAMLAWVRAVQAANGIR